MQQITDIIMLTMLALSSSEIVSDRSNVHSLDRVVVEERTGVFRSSGCSPTESSGTFLSVVVK